MKRLILLILHGWLALACGKTNQVPALVAATWIPKGTVITSDLVETAERWDATFSGDMFRPEDRSLLIDDTVLTNLNPGQAFERRTMKALVAQAGAPRQDVLEHLDVRKYYRKPRKEPAPNRLSDIKIKDLEFENADMTLPEWCEELLRLAKQDNKDVSDLKIRLESPDAEHDLSKARLGPITLSLRRLELRDAVRFITKISNGAYWGEPLGPGEDILESVDPPGGSTRVRMPLVPYAEPPRTLVIRTGYYDPVLYTALASPGGTGAFDTYHLRMNFDQQALRISEVLHQIGQVTGTEIFIECDLGGLEDGLTVRFGPHALTAYQALHAVTEVLETHSKKDLMLFAYSPPAYAENGMKSEALSLREMDPRIDKHLGFPKDWFTVYELFTKELRVAGPDGNEPVKTVEEALAFMRTSPMFQNNWKGFSRTPPLRWDSVLNAWRADFPDSFLAYRSHWSIRHRDLKASYEVMRDQAGEPSLVEIALAKPAPPFIHPVDLGSEVDSWGFPKGFQIQKDLDPDLEDHFDDFFADDFQDEP